MPVLNKYDPSIFHEYGILNNAFSLPVAVLPEAAIHAVQFVLYLSNINFKGVFSLMPKLNQSFNALRYLKAFRASVLVAVLVIKTNNDLPLASPVYARRPPPSIKLKIVALFSPSRYSYEDLSVMLSKSL